MSGWIHLFLVIAPVVRVPVQYVSLDHAIPRRLAIKLYAYPPFNLASKRVYTERGWLTHNESLLDRLRLRPESGGTVSSGFSPSPDPPPPTREDHAGTKIPQETGGEEHKDNDRLTFSQLSPGKGVEGCRDDSENDDGIRQSSAPATGVSVAVSPMRPSRKRVSSAGRESDTEPGGALPDEWGITETNQEGEVRGGVGGKEVQQARCMAAVKKPWGLAQPLYKKNGVASSSLSLTRRLKTKAVRESPRVRKLRDKLAGRVGARGGTRSPENAGASRTTSVAMPQDEGKGSDRWSSGEVVGPSMPYNGGNVSSFSPLVGCEAWPFEI